MAGYKGDLGSSPLDGLVKLIDDVRHGSRDAKKKVKDVATAPKRKVQQAVSRVAPAKKCGSEYHRKWRGKNCDRCGTRVL